MGPYNTYVASQYLDRISETRKVLSEQRAMGGGDNLLQISKHIFAATAANERAPHWPHPFIHDGVVFFDPRPFYNREGAIRNHTEFTFMRRRAQAEYLWQTQPEAFEPLIRPLALVYSQWVSSGIASRFAMPPNDAAVIRVVATAYYIAVMLGQIEGRAPKFEDVERTLVRTVGARGAWIPPQLVTEVMQNPEVQDWLTNNPGSIAQMAEAIRSTITTAVGDLSAVTLVQLMGSGSWLGQDNIALSLLALEYPPMLAVMVAQSEVSNMHRSKTRVGRACAAMQRGAALKTVVTFIQGLDDADEPI